MMFDRLTRMQERSTRRTASGVALSVLVHALVLALLLYGSERVRRATAPEGRGRGEGGSAGGPLRIPGQEAPPEGVGADGATGAELLLAGVVLPPEMLREAGLPPVLPRLPDTLELGRPETIRLAIPRNRLPEDSVLRYRDEHGVGISPVRLSRARQATLHGASFAIQPASPPLQMSDPRRRTEWHWTLTPTQPGLQTLHLQLDAPAVVGGDPRVVTLQRLRQEVYVRATPLQRISRFFADYWTALVAVTLFALLTTARALLAGRR